MNRSYCNDIRRGRVGRCSFRADLRLAVVVVYQYNTRYISQIRAFLWCRGELSRNVLVP